MLRKGQAATEFLVILGVALAILVVIVGIGYKSLNQGNSQYELNKANIVLSDLDNAAKLVYQQGVGAKTKVYVTMPDEISSIDLSGQSIVINFNSGDQKFKNFGFNVSGNVGTSGNVWVYVEAMEGYVSLNHNATSQGGEESGGDQGGESSWQTVFFDYFDRSNGNDIGNNWTETGGKWEIKDYRTKAKDCKSPGDQMTSINIDLSEKTNATLTFEWEYKDLDSDECLSLDLNDGDGWINEVFSQCSSSNNQDASGNANIIIGDYISLTSTVQLRYDCLSSKKGEEAYIDNVNVSVYS